MNSLCAHNWNKLTTESVSAYTGCFDLLEFFLKYTCFTYSCFESFLFRYYSKESLRKTRTKRYKHFFFFCGEKQTGLKNNILYEINFSYYTGSISNLPIFLVMCVIMKLISRRDYLTVSGCLVYKFLCKRVKVRCPDHIFSEVGRIFLPHLCNLLTCTSNTSGTEGCPVTLNKVSWSNVRVKLDLCEKSLSKHNYIFLPMILSGPYITIKKCW